MHKKHKKRKKRKTERSRAFIKYHTRLSWRPGTQFTNARLSLSARTVRPYIVASIGLTRAKWARINYKHFAVWLVVLWFTILKIMTSFLSPTPKLSSCLSSERRTWWRQFWSYCRVTKSLPSLFWYARWSSSWNWRETSRAFTAQNYSLRNRPHNRQLPDRLSRITDCNFTVRLLYRNMYWLLYILDMRFVLFLCTTAVWQFAINEYECMNEWMHYLHTGTPSATGLNVNNNGYEWVTE